MRIFMEDGGARAAEGDPCIALPLRSAAVASPNDGAVLYSCYSNDCRPICHPPKIPKNSQILMRVSYSKLGGYTC